MNEEVHSGTTTHDALEDDSGQAVRPSKCEPDQEKVQHEALLKRLAYYTSEVRSVVVNLLLLTVVVAIGVVLTWELSRNTVIVKPLGVPGKLAEQGYTGEILARRLIDELARIRKGATTRKHDINPEVFPDWSQPDIDIPGASMSLGTIVRYVKESFSDTGLRISGEVTRGEDYLMLRLRERHDGTFEDIMVGSSSEIDRLLNLGARELMKRIDPYVLASYLKDKDVGQSLDVIAYCLAKKPKEDDHWAYNLWGEIMLDQKHYQEAFEHFESAIKLKNDYFLAYSNSGIALAHLGRFKDAEAKHEAAKKIAPKDPSVYRAWGLSLGLKGDHQGAIEKHEEVVKILPNSRRANINYGNALRDIKKYEDAERYLKKAIRLDGEYGMAYYNLGLLFKVKGGHVKALACFDKALATKLTDKENKDVESSKEDLKSQMDEEKPRTARHCMQ